VWRGDWVLAVFGKFGIWLFDPNVIVFSRFSDYVF
jgi:hypothetical protein